MPTAKETPRATVSGCFLSEIALRPAVRFKLGSSIDATGMLRSAYRNLLFFWRQRTEDIIDLVTREVKCL